MTKLINRNGLFPPGGWQFKDSRTGMRFTDGDFNDVVAAIIKHRKANPRLYPPDEIEAFDFASVANELDAHTCSRLKGDSRFCQSGDPIPVNTDGLELMLMPNSCPKCDCKTGWQNLCRTCAGKRVVSYICENCKSLVAK